MEWLIIFTHDLSGTHYEYLTSSEAAFDMFRDLSNSPAISFCAVMIVHQKVSYTRNKDVPNSVPAEALEN